MKKPHRRNLRLLICCLALTVTIGTASAAEAGAAGTASLSSDKTTLTYVGAAGTTSNLKISYQGVALILEETSGNAGAPLQAGPGCTVTLIHRKISCPTVSIVSITLNMGDLTDSVLMGAAVVSPPPPNTALYAIPPHVMTVINDVGSVTASDGPVEVYCTDGGNVKGGAGYDNIFVTGAVAHVNGGAKDDQITIKNSVITPPNVETSYSVNGGPGHDLIDASESSASLMYDHSAGTDVVLGSSSADEFVFGEDRDLVFGNGGDDRFYDAGPYTGPEAALSEIWGGPGDDVFTDRFPKRKEVTHFEGGPGQDRVTYATTNSDGWNPDVHISFDEPADDGVIGFGGENEGDHYHVSVENIGNYQELPSMNQMGGNDHLVGSAKPNNINGHDGDDSIFGEAGNDYITGGNGNDTIDGGDGDDTIDQRNVSSAYMDTVAGGQGNDLFLSTGSGQGFQGEAGDDRVSYASANGVVVDTHEGNYSPDWFDSIESILGSPGADTFLGGESPDIFDGSGGDDTFVVVEGGSDQITCGDGTDDVTADATDLIADPANCESVTIE